VPLHGLCCSTPSGRPDAIVQSSRPPCVGLAFARPLFSENQAGRPLHGAFRFNGPSTIQRYIWRPTNRSPNPPTSLGAESACSVTEPTSLAGSFATPETPEDIDCPGAQVRRRLPPRDGPRWARYINGG